MVPSIKEEAERVFQKVEQKAAETHKELDDIPLMELDKTAVSTLDAEETDLYTRARTRKLAEVEGVPIDTARETVHASIGTILGDQGDDVKGKWSHIKPVGASIGQQ